MTGAKPLAFALLMALAPAADALGHVPDNKPLAALEATDQADRSPGSNAIDWAIVGKHDAARREQTMALLRDGAVRTAMDYFRAALIFQHGDAIDDTRLALALATTASRLDPSNADARVLCAQAWDRILVKSGKPQWYGTQFAKNAASGRWEISPVEPGAVSEAQRTAMGLPTREATQAHLDAMNQKH